MLRVAGGNGDNAGAGHLLKRFDVQIRNESGSHQPHSDI
jgi:hypothetical protein